MRRGPQAHGRGVPYVACHGISTLVLPSCAFDHALDLAQQGTRRAAAFLPAEPQRGQVQAAQAVHVGDGCDGESHCKRTDAHSLSVALLQTEQQLMGDDGVKPAAPELMDLEERTDIRCPRQKLVRGAVTATELTAPLPVVRRAQPELLLLPVASAHKAFPLVRQGAGSGRGLPIRDLKVGSPSPALAERGGMGRTEPMTHRLPCTPTCVVGNQARLAIRGPAYPPLPRRPVGRVELLVRQLAGPRCNTAGRTPADTARTRRPAGGNPAA